jgi:hypothetical protein
MRITYYVGWLQMALGVVLGVGMIGVGLAPVGGILLVSLVGAGAFMVWLSKGWDKPLDSAAELYKYGRPANATVLSVEEPSLSSDGTRTAKVKFHVRPVNESSFKTTRVVAIPGGNVPREGQEVTVKFDPQSRKNVVLLEQAFAVEDHATAARKRIQEMAGQVGPTS